MKQLLLKLTAQSPLSVRSDHTANGIAVTEYIPGTTLLGCLASFHRLLHPTEEELFQSIFLSGQVHFSNLYPADCQDKDLADILALPIYPMPKTAQSCKRHSGFKFPEKPGNDAHGVRDTLLDWAMFKLGKSSPELLKRVFHEDIKQCRICGEKMDHFDEYYRRGAKSNSMSQAKVKKRLHTHTGINRVSGTIQEGILYNREGFVEGSRFWGKITLPDDERLYTELNNFIEAVGSGGLLHMGTGRTRGRGKVILAIIEEDVFFEEVDPFVPFEQRVKGFDTLLHEQAKKYDIELKPDGFFFALTLHAPLILCDEQLRYRGTLDGKTITEALKLPAETLTRIYQVAAVQQILGWQELWGAPRMQEYGIESGSVFLFRCTAPLDDELLQALFQLEEQGMGKRRAEGFGRICISDAFHQEVNVK